MKSLLLALFVCGFAGVCIAGVVGGYGGGYSLGYGGGFGRGFGGHGYGGGLEHGLGLVKTVPGPSFLVKTVHNVNRVSHGSTLFGHYGHGGGYGGGYGGALVSGGYGGGLGGGYAKVAVKG